MNEDDSTHQSIELLPEQIENQDRRLKKIEKTVSAKHLESKTEKELKEAESLGAQQPCEIEVQDKLPKRSVNIDNEEDFLKHLLKIEAKDVNLKFVFDHIRNYGICGLMLGIGIKVFEHPDQVSALRAMFDFLAGGLLIALPWGLFALNFYHGLLAFIAIRDAKEVNKYWYLAITILLFFAASKLMLYALNL